MNKSVLIVGAGPMAVAYAKVLQSLQYSCTVIGRGEQSAVCFERETGIPVKRGGIETYLADSPQPYRNVIVAVSEKKLGTTTCQLINAGYQKILVEKPGGFDSHDIVKVKDTAIERGASVIIAYNRRLYASTQYAKKLIAIDGGVVSFNFEFTEWSHKIKDLPKEEGVKEQWLLHNSTHVIDLAFYLGGYPREMHCFQSGYLPWRRGAARFCGAGTSESGALFSYHATWDAPGRWGVEILTNANRFYLRPLEQLAIQKIGSVSIESVTIDDNLDTTYKPGIFLQVKQFLDDDYTELCTIEDQCNHLKYFCQVAGMLDKKACYADTLLDSRH